MPVYGFACDCGQHSETFFEPEQEKMLRCPNCGAWMYRDWSGLLIGGDLPSRYTVVGPDGQTHYGIKSHERAAEARGSHLYATGDLPEDPIIKEADYTDKHAAPSERKEAKAHIQKMGADMRRQQRRALVHERISKAKVDPPRGFDLQLGD